jgi:type IV pilus assembly protein PilW
MTRRRCARGLGLVEMLVTIILGLFLVSATAGLLVSQLAEHRRVLLETRLTQELRAVLDLVVRDVRRAGYWGTAADAAWTLERSSTLPNPYDGLHPAAGQVDARLGYTYSRDNEDQIVSGNERFGLRLNTSNRSADWRTSGAALAPADSDTWQALTDPGLLRVTRISVTTREQSLALSDRCALLGCAAGATNCPPRLALRRVDIEVEGVATTDAALRRTLVASVSLRNPSVAGSCTGS